VPKILVFPNTWIYGLLRHLPKSILFLDFLLPQYLNLRIAETLLNKNVDPNTITSPILESTDCWDEGSSLTLGVRDLLPQYLNLRIAETWIISSEPSALVFPNTWIYGLLRRLQESAKISCQTASPILESTDCWDAFESYFAPVIIQLPQYLNLRIAETIFNTKKFAI